MMSRKLDHTNNFSKMRPTDNKFGSNFFHIVGKRELFFRENRFDPEKHIFYEKITFMSPKCLCTWKARRKQCFQHSREHFTNYFTWNQFWLLNYTSHVILTYLGISLPLLWFYVKSILVRMRNDFTYNLRGRKIFRFHFQSFNFFCAKVGNTSQNTLFKHFQSMFSI